MFVVHFILGEYYLLLFFTKVNKSIESASSAQESSPHLQPKAKEEPRTTLLVGSVPSQNPPPSIFPYAPRNKRRKKGYRFSSYTSDLAMKLIPKYALHPSGVISRVPKLQRNKIRSTSKEKSRADPSRTTPANRAHSEHQIQGISLLLKHPPYPRVKAPTLRRAKRRPTVGRLKNQQ